MDNFYHNLMLNIANYFLKSDKKDETILNIRNIASLIRIHNKMFKQIGEVSFPCEQKLWEKYFPTDKGFTVNREAIENLSEKETESCKQFVLESIKWSFPVSHIHIHKERCHLYLERQNVMAKLIQQVMNDDKFGYLPKDKNMKVYLKPLQDTCLPSEDIFYQRVTLVHATLQKLLEYSRYNVLQEDQTSALRINVSSVPSNLCDNNIEDINIRCGPVIYPATNGKIVHYTSNEYLSCLSDNARQVALFRDRLTILNEKAFNDLIERLGTADVTVRLLNVKHSSPVQIKTPEMGGNKGALFVLYNTARLETILRTFEEHIKYKTYDKQPELKDIDWNLLSEEEEWQLVFNYIAGFPDLIDRCVENLDRGIFAVHLIVHFLIGLVSLFSKYYIRIRILTEKRNHLMPYVYARIYLLQALRVIINKTLAFLDIEPVESM